MLAAIRALPDRQREALVLRFYLDMSEEETARAMGISRGTVKSATSRAVAALGRMLKEELMSTTKDRARAAMRAIAGTVHDAPPLRLPPLACLGALPGSRRRWRALAPRRRWGAWLAPRSRRRRRGQRWRFSLVAV